MYTDEIYKRSMGMRYNPDRLRAQVANGMSGYDGGLDRSNGMELSSADLYLEASEDIRGVRLQEIEYELYEHLKEPHPTDEAVETVLMLEVEKTMIKEEIAIEVVTNNPLDTERLMHELESLNNDRAEAIKDYLTTNLMEHGAKGAPVDAEMYEEARLLGEFIADANPGETPEGLVEVAKAMKAAIIARIDLNHALSIA